jgi:hypothetical protein
MPDLGALHQPYTSFGGRPPEVAEGFYTRVSERLRHKGRALTPWDYERLVLDAFPDIYKVRCLPAAPEDPGRVALVLVPDIRNRLPFAPLTPKVSTATLADVEALFADKVSTFARVRARNPRFVSVQVRVAIRYREGVDIGFYSQRINQELRRFLSPWAYDAEAEIAFGGRIYANLIVDYLERRPYVDYVANISLYRSIDGRDYEPVLRDSEEKGYWVEADGPDAILVTAPRHVFDLIAEEIYEEADYSGINYMRVGLDFIVA